LRPLPSRLLSLICAASIAAFQQARAQRQFGKFNVSGGFSTSGSSETSGGFKISDNFDALVNLTPQCIQHNRLSAPENLVSQPASKFSVILALQRF
jgi:hypothetical protein